MRHQKIKGKLNKRTGQRKALLRSMATALIEKESITTTRTRAKVLKSFAEKLITKAKRDTVSSRRTVYRKVPNNLFVDKLFKEIAPLYSKTDGGYLRIIPYKFRAGDGADMALIELTQKTKKIIDRAKKKEESAKSAGEKSKSPKADKAPVVPAAKTSAETGMIAEAELKTEKTPEESKKPKNQPKIEKRQKKPFLSNVKKYFRRKQRDQ